MKKATILTTLAVVAAVNFSCTKEKNILPKEESNNQKEELGHPVTLTFSLTDDTKISHPLDGTTIKPTWEAGDCIKLTHGTTDELFTLVGEGGTTSGTFTCASSTLAEGNAYTVVYYKNDRAKASSATDWAANYAATADWSVQDGTLANLPEYLTGSGTYPAAATLSSGLTYFHFEISHTPSANHGSALAVEHAYLRSNKSSIKMNKGKDTEGYITITLPSSAKFDFGLDGTPTSPIDIYIAAQIEGNTKDVVNALGVVFKDEGHKNPCYYLDWTPVSNYTSGKAYKKTDATDKLNYGILVGDINKENTFFVDKSDLYEIPRGNKLTLHLTNFSSIDQEYYSSIIALVNKASGDGYHEFSVHHPGAYAWGDFGSTAAPTRSDFDSNAWIEGFAYDSDKVKATLNGAYVTVIIDYDSSNYAFMHVICESTDPAAPYSFHKSFFQYIDPSLIVDNKLQLFITNEKSYCIINDSRLETATEKLGSIHDDAWKYWQAFSTDTENRISIASGASETLYMYVFSNAYDLTARKSADPWQLWVAPMINLASTDGDVTTRLDNWVNSANDAIFNNGTVGNKKQNFEADGWWWDNYLTYLNNSRMTIKITNNGDNTATVRYAVKSINNDYHYQNYYNINLNSDNLKYRVEVNGSSVILLDETIAASYGFPSITD